MKINDDTFHLISLC